MNEQTRAFRFQLSPAELHWVAGAFGLRRLHLVDDPLRDAPPSRLEQALKDGLASLQGRHLIERLNGAGWDVDRVPAGIVRWMGAADTLAIMQFHIRSGSSYQTHIYLKEAAAMAATLRSGSYSFTIYPERAPCFGDLLGSVGAAFSDMPPETATYDLPQPVPVICAGWKEAALADKMLRAARLKPREIKPLLVWIQSLQWLCTLTEFGIGIRDAGKAPKLRAILCGDRHNVWNAWMPLEDEEVYCLIPTPRKQVPALLYNLL